MSTREIIEDLKTKLTEAEQAYRASLAKEVEAIEARLRQIQAEIGGIESATEAPKRTTRFAPVSRRPRGIVRSSILKAMSGGSMTCDEIAARIGTSYFNAYCHLRRLKSQNLVVESNSEYPRKWHLAEGISASATTNVVSIQATRDRKATTITKTQMQVMTAIGARALSCQSIANQLKAPNATVYSRLMGLKARGLVVEMSDTRPSRWRLANAAEATAQPAE